MKEKYLPVGTVVRLADAEVKLMITGYRVLDERGIEFDYCGAIYPLGNSSDLKATFNHEQISEIPHMGYETEEFTKYNEFLKKIKK